MPSIQRGKAIGVLNRLKEEGLISDFRTELFGTEGGGKPEVTVTVAGELDRARREEVVQRVMRELEPFVGGVTVTVLRDPHSNSRG